MRSECLPFWQHRFILGFPRETNIPPQWSSLFVPSSVLRHGAKSRLSHQPPSWGARSAKCHLSWQGLQVGCNHDCTVLPGPESGIFLLDTEMRGGFSGDGWEICFGQSFVLLSISVLFAHAPCLFCPSSPFFVIPEPSPLTLHVYLFCWYLTSRDFVFPGIPQSSSSGEKGKKRMRDWKFVEKSFWRTFLDYVHKAQAAHSVNMARCQWDLFPWRLFLYSNNQGADSTVAQEGEKESFIQFDTPCVTF